MGIKVTSPPRVESNSSNSSISSISSTSTTPPAVLPPPPSPVEAEKPVSMKSKNGLAAAGGVSSTVLAPVTATSNATATATCTTSTSTTKVLLPFYTMQQVAEMSAKLKQTWIVINGNIHNVSVFMEQHHPGGDLVIFNMRNQDCTLVFENYHFTKLNLARSMLRRYCPLVGTLVPKNATSKQQQEQYYPRHVQHFRAIQQELYNNGMFEVNDMFYYKLYVWLALLFASSLYLTLCPDGSFQSHLCGAFLMGCFWQQLAGLGHDLGHSNVSRNYGRDHLNSSIFGCSLSGISNAWWKRNHNTHHVVCNSVEHDPDIQHLPTFAISPLIIQSPYFSSYYQKWFSFHQNDVVARFFVSYQHYFLIPIMLVARFNMYAQSWLFLLNFKNKTKFRCYEIVALGIFATWYSAVALSLPTLLETAAWVLVSHGVAGILHIQIIISHWAMETYRQDDDDHDKKKNDDNKSSKNDNDDKKNDNDNIDWYQLQLKTTMNIDCPPWMDWFHFGLQYQVEHHLFPSLPRHSLRQASRLVKKACREHGIPYHHDSFYGALCQTLTVLKETAIAAQQQSRGGGKLNTNLLVDALNCNG